MWGGLTVRFWVIMFNEKKILWMGYFNFFTEKMVYTSLVVSLYS